MPEIVPRVTQIHLPVRHLPAGGMAQCLVERYTYATHEPGHRREKDHRTRQPGANGATPGWVCYSVPSQRWLCSSIKDVRHWVALKA